MIREWCSDRERNVRSGPAGLTRRGQRWIIRARRRPDDAGPRLSREETTMVDKSSDRPGEGHGGLSRRDLLVGAGTVLLAGGLAACGGSGGSSGATGGSTAAGTPKRGGNFRLAVTGGGASDIIDGQSIITKPDQARLAASWETLVSYDDQYVLQIGGDQGGLAEEFTRTTRPSGRSGCARASSSTTARRSPPTMSSTRSSASSIPRRACSGRPAWPPSTRRTSTSWIRRPCACT